jgi:hypothetical protein
MPLREPNVDELILTAHSAALEPNGWDRLGHVLLNVLSAEKGMGLRISSEEHPEPWAVLLDYDPSAVGAYARDWHRMTCGITASCALDA